MQLACVLQGPHRSSAVTAVSWCAVQHAMSASPSCTTNASCMHAQKAGRGLAPMPLPVATGVDTMRGPFTLCLCRCPECHSRSMGSAGASLRLASGDTDGRVVIWDIATGTPVLTLEDPLHAAAGPKSDRGKGGAVRGLAWVLASPARLGIVTASGAFLVWDVEGERGSRPAWGAVGHSSTCPGHLITACIAKRASKPSTACCCTSRFESLQRCWLPCKFGRILLPGLHREKPGLREYLKRASRGWGK